MDTDNTTELIDIAFNPAGDPRYRALITGTPDGREIFLGPDVEVADDERGVTLSAPWAPGMTANVTIASMLMPAGKAALVAPLVRRLADLPRGTRISIDAV